MEWKRMFPFLQVNFESSDDDLRGEFEQFGEIIACNIKRDSASQKGQGFGFITFKNEADGLRAIEEMHGKMWLAFLFCLRSSGN